MSGSSTTSPGAAGANGSPEQATDTSDSAAGGAAKRGPGGRRRSAAAEAERALRRRSRRNIAITTGTAALILLGGAVGYGIWQAQRSFPYPVPAHATRNAEGLVAGGTGRVTVDVYADFACRACQAFARDAGPTLDQMVASGQITLVYHPISQLDSARNGQYSTRAAASLGCAADLSHLAAYVDALWATEPSGTSGLTDDQIIQVGGAAGMIDPRFAECVRAERYRTWVGKVTDAADTGRLTGTPEVLVDGTDIAPAGSAPTTADLAAAVASAAATAHGN